ncbi:MAG: ACT domain-containing protein [Planctomycetota bacterium]|nr:ACT domain-containing protein [Planctomycetota bacterium]MDA1025320.1 ACT domain-containing protein [Planctomycetota bacterium]
MSAEPFASPSRSLISRPGEFAVLRLPVGADVPAPTAGSSLLDAVVRTPDETSVVRSWSDPLVKSTEASRRAGPFRAWSIPGTLDFELVGVLVGFIEPLRDAGVPILAISTFETDWILVDATRATAAESAWIAAGVRLLDRVD